MNHIMTRRMKWGAIIVLTIMCLLLFMVWCRDRQTSLQGVALVQGQYLIDISNSGFMMYVWKQGLHVYDWNGHLRDRIPRTPKASQYLHSRESKIWFPPSPQFTTWIAPDAVGYAPDSMPLREWEVTTARFSPDGQWIGNLDFNTQYLEVMVRRDGRTRWRRRLPISPTGPLTGHQFFDLLVDNNGRVLLYRIPHTTSKPVPIPMMIITQHGVQTTTLHPTFQTLISQYQHALMRHPHTQVNLKYLPSGSDNIWTPDGQYHLSLDSRENLFEELIAIFISRKFEGCTRLSITKRPGIKLMRCAARNWRDDDLYFISLPFQGKTSIDYEDNRDHGAFFSPDGSRLLIQRAVTKASQEDAWAVFKY